MPIIHISLLEQPKLIQLCKGKNREAFSVLIQPYLEFLYNFVLRKVRNHEDAMDILQNSLINVWKSFPSFQGIPPKAWLRRVARNQVLDFIKSQKASKRSKSRTESLNTETFNQSRLLVNAQQEKTFFDKEHVESLLEAIKTDADLTERERKIALLRCAGLVASEIASTLGSPETEKTVSATYVVIRKKLKRWEYL